MIPSINSRGVSGSNVLAFKSDCFCNMDGPRDCHTEPSAGQGPIVSSWPGGWGSALISLGGGGGGCPTSTRQASSADAWDSPEPLGSDRTVVTAQT